MIRRTLRTTLVLLAAFAASSSAAGKGYLWWEGEDTDKTNMSVRHPFSPRNDRESAVLSDGAWLGHTGKMPNETAFAEYTIEVPQQAEYDFFVRKFWKHGPFRWRFDEGPWQKVTREVALLDTSSLRTHTSVSWVKAGVVELGAGTHTLRVELLPDKSKAACFDAFLLTTRPFQARGALKPDAKLGKAPEGWFPFEPDWDPFEDSPMDLRRLNEKQAGDGGFIVARGEQFVHSQTGKPVRFWAVNTGHAIAQMDRKSIDTLARFLAKRGVNLVRIHGGFYEGRGPNASRIDPDKIDRIHYLVAALKREGIYSGMSIHFQHWLNLAEDDRVPGFNKKLHRPYAIHFFSPDYMEIFKGWWRKVLTKRNPHTGLSLAEDPAVAYCEIINEDSFFFWTFQPYERIPAEHMPHLEKMFGQWLAKKYGSIAKAFAAWDAKPGDVKGDHPGEGRVGLYFIGMLTGNDWAVNQRNEQRARDTARFLVETQYDWFAMMQRYIKEDLGFGGAVCGSNMGTADHNVLLPLERYAETACDFLDHHGYYGGAKKQAGRPHFAMEVGDSYTDRSVLRMDPKAPGQGGVLPAIPFLAPTYDGKCSNASEFAWVQPNQYHAEQVVLAGVLGRTTGLDGVIHFALDTTPQWSSRLNTYWDIQVPTVIGQFPAMAMVYRQGLVAEGKSVVRAKLGMEKLLKLEGSPVLPPKVGDDLNEQMAPSGENTAVQGDRIDPRAFVVGKVNVDFIKGASEHMILSDDLSRYIDNDAKRMTSSAGDWTWDYKTGLLAIEADSAQGACGFLRWAGAIDTGDLTITSPMNYGAIVAVALDGKPIAESGRILLQVISQAQDYGYKAVPATGMRKIVDRGTPPIILRNIQGTVSLKRPDAAGLTVTALDFNGYPTQTTTGATKIDLSPDVLYYVIEK